MTQPVLDLTLPISAPNSDERIYVHRTDSNVLVPVLLVDLEPVTAYNLKIRSIGRTDGGGLGTAAGSTTLFASIITSTLGVPSTSIMQTITGVNSQIAILVGPTQINYSVASGTVGEAMRWKHHIELIKV